jgi:hypothetical protein
MSFDPFVSSAGRQRVECLYRTKACLTFDYGNQQFREGVVGYLFSGQSAVGNGRVVPRDGLNVSWKQVPDHSSGTAHFEN